MAGDINLDRNYAYEDLKAAINTLNATRWELFKVRLFGSESVFKTARNTVVTRFYKDKTYLITYK
jgi:hypothetical protein